MTDQTRNRPIALVTGANKGIGRAIAERLARCEMSVYASARDAERGERTVREIAAGGLDVRFVRIDVTDQDSIAQAASRIDADAGRLDILVNNAGIATDLQLAPSETPIDELRRVYETNVFGVAAVTNAMLPLLRRSSKPRIVNLTSDLGSLHHATAGDHPLGALPPLLAYNSSKTAVNALTVTYANELREQGIPVLMATLDDDGPTGTFRVEDGTPEGRVAPW